MPETRRCTYTSDPVIVDGHLDEPSWTQAEVLEFFVPESGEPVISRTDGRMLWDDNFLYAGFHACDRDVWSYQTERDCPTCHEDVLELFFMPDEASGIYYNFEINALGTVYDACNRPPYLAGGADMIRWKQWDCQDLSVGIHVEGAINDLDVEDEFWQLEIAVPFASLPTVDGPPAPGDRWRFHLSRYDYSIYLPEGRELSSTAHLSKCDFHYFQDWDVLEFQQ